MFRFGSKWLPKYTFRTESELLHLPHTLTTETKILIHAFLPPRAVVREVGLRDGLQSIARILPTAHKIEWIRAAHAAGQREIEVGSFVPARLLPQLADTAELVAFAQDAARLVRLGAGAQPEGRRARARRRRRPDAACRCPPATRTASPTCARRPTMSSPRSRASAPRATPRASRALIEVGISTAFGCTIQGQRRARGSAAPRAGGCSTRAPTASASPTPSATPIRCMVRDAVRAGARDRRRSALRAATSTTRAASALANVFAALADRRRALRRVRSPASAAARTRRARAATSRPRTSPTCSRAWASRPASTSTRLLALRAEVAGWLEGETLHGIAVARRLAEDDRRARVAH